MIYPIWKTITADLTSELVDGVVDFTLTGGALNYSGRAYADADGNCIITLNDLIAPHLGADINPQGASGQDAGALVTFTLSYGYSTDTFVVLNDWSYDRARTWDDDEPLILAAPVTEKWDCRVQHPLVVVNAVRYKITYTPAVGTAQVEQDTLSEQSSVLMIGAHNPGTIKVEVWDAEDVKAEQTFALAELCNPATLIYRNAIGGYDLLPLASAVEVNAYQRGSFEIAGNNAQAYTHLRREFRTEQSKTFTLRTLTLTDAEAARMDTAVGSPQAWLYTPEYGYAAVLIDTASVKRKTFKNEGRQRVEYSLDVTLAQPLARQ